MNAFHAHLCHMFRGLQRKANILKFDFLVLLLCMGGIYQSARKAGLPVQLHEQGGHIIVHQIKATAGRAGLRPGDSILAVKGQTVVFIEDMEFLMDGQAIGYSLDFTVLRDGRKITLSIPLQAANDPLYLFVLTLVGFIFFSLGVFVLKNRPDGDVVALVFHWISVTVALHITTTFGRYSLSPLHVGYVLRLIFFLASSLTPVLFVHFSFLFPQKKGIAYRKYMKMFYALAIIFFLYLSFLFLQAAEASSILLFHRFMFVYNFGRWLFAVSFIFAVGNFFHSYIKAGEESQRRKLRWVILGLAIGPLSFVLFWQIPQTMALEPLLPEEAMLLITALTPLTFAISIVRYHLLDIDFIFNRSTVYLIVLSLLLLLYAAIVGLASMMVQIFTVRVSLMVSALASVVLALLFEPLRKAVQKFVDKRFFRVRYDYRLAQREITQRIHRFIDVRSLFDFSIDQLDALLRPERLGLFYIDESTDEWQLSAQKNLHSISSGFRNELHRFTENSLLPFMAVARFIEPGIPFWPGNPEIFKQNQIVIALPIRLQSARNAGFLLLGKKKSAALYGQEDIDLLKTTVMQIASAIERIRLQRNLILQHAETRRLDELNRMKSYFVSSVSHELQTPLTSIRMFVELLQNNKRVSLKDRQEYLEIIQGESERLSRLIRNVLDFSRVERGVKTYRRQRMNLTEVVRSVLRSMKYQLRQNQFETFFQIPEEKIFIQADADAVAEALDNLISNAIKYSTKRKYIRISLSVNGGYARLEVEDKGIGIAQQEQQHIFETYYRAGEAQTRTGSGTGLGLSLVHHIMEAHGGKIEVNSKPGFGSTFTLYFPLENIK